MEEEEPNPNQYIFVKDLKFISQAVDPNAPPPYFLLFRDDFVSYVPIKARFALHNPDNTKSDKRR